MYLIAHGRKSWTSSAQQTSKSYRKIFFHASTEIQGCQKHHFNGRNPLHATKCNLFLKVMVLETVNGMHIKARLKLRKKKCKSKKKQSANKPEITTATKLSIPGRTVYRCLLCFLSTYQESTFLVSYKLVFENYINLCSTGLQINSKVIHSWI